MFCHYGSTTLLLINFDLYIDLVRAAVASRTFGLTGRLPLCFAQFPGHGELLWGEAEGWR